jgi:hypothetical protein
MSVREVMMLYPTAQQSLPEMQVTSINTTGNVLSLVFGELRAIPFGTPLLNAGDSAADFD